MGQFHWDPESYLAMMREEVPAFERLQDAATEATGTGAARILELGTGTGETARRVLARHPAARLIGIDASAAMLEAARGVLADERVELRVGRLEEPLPAGPFDVVVSALCVHHLDGAAKAELFRRVAAALAPGGRFVLADVVVPDDPADVVTPIDGVYDVPSTVAEQLAWMREASLDAGVAWLERDLAVLVGRG
jgi:tRNA (cmo5U34)-methyltransferase